MNIPVVVCGETCIETYRAAVDQLRNHSGLLYHLILNIQEPWRNAEAEYLTLNPKFTKNSASDIRNVANTIFPDRVRTAIPLVDFLRKYYTLYERAGSRHPRVWGTYFQRLLSFGPTNRNQLLEVITAINTWNGGARKSAFVFHLSGFDRPRPLGAPCWQYGQLTCESDNSIHLSVVYRSHDYFDKALGNLWGLSRLLKFICDETGKSVGSLNCHSMHAHFHNASNQDVQNLIS